jgi:hypothetical protein
MVLPCWKQDFPIWKREGFQWGLPFLKLSMVIAVIAILISVEKPVGSSSGD